MIQPSSPNPARRLAHTRQIVCSGYARSDGLFDIEASPQDTKADEVAVLAVTKAHHAPNKEADSSG
jgi:hypothetical protein